MGEVFTKELREQAKSDPIFKDFSFCDECMEHAEKWIIYIRQLENAQVVAKDALETLNHANAKLTKDIEWLQEELDKARKALDGRERETIKGKMKDLENAHHRFVNRSKM